MLDLLRRGEPVPPRLHRDDVLGGVAVALAILLATLPVVIPFAVLRETDLAVRASNSIAVALLFLLGYRWGMLVDRSPWRIGAQLTAVGIMLVLLTIALGG